MISLSDRLFYRKIKICLFISLICSRYSSDLTAKGGYLCDKEKASSQKSKGLITFLYSDKKVIQKVSPTISFIHRTLRETTIFTPGFVNTKQHPAT